jgi:hypothetical protein
MVMLVELPLKALVDVRYILQSAPHQGLACLK